MRFGLGIPACVVVFVASVVTAPATLTVKPAPADLSKELGGQQHRIPHPQHFFSFRSLEWQVDNQVIANLLTDTPSRTSDVTVSVVAGEIARCESKTCQVPMTVRVGNASGPVALTFAVANPRGQISEVKHVECNTGSCAVSLILERGQNTVSIGVLDGIAQTTGYATKRVNAMRNVADRGNSEWF